MEAISYTPIGTIHSPFTQTEGTPIQAKAALGIRGHVIIDESFVEALDDLEGFSHIYLLYHFHLSTSYEPKVVPFMDKKLRGVFSTRAPKRPNPIGLSVVKLNHIDGNRLEIENMDMVDGTPLLDIKPYVPDMDENAPCRIGWLTEHIHKMRSLKSDDRFK